MSHDGALPSGPKPFSAVICMIESLLAYELFFFARAAF